MKTKKERVKVIIRELIQYLQEQEGKDLILHLYGIITMNFLVEEIRVKQKEKDLFLENTQKSVGFNLSQLMKITPIRKNEILLEFDPLQSVIIRAR